MDSFSFLSLRFVGPPVLCSRRPVSSRRAGRGLKTGPILYNSAVATKEQPNPAVLDGKSDALATPYYLVDEAALKRNLEIIDQVRRRTGAKAVLALKCFSTWSAFPMMRPYLDGTTSSSLFEARLGAEKFGGETHAYSVGFSDDEIDGVRDVATKIIFNSLSQLERYGSRFSDIPVGLRINPGVSHSDFDLADPARRYCRLGVADPAAARKVAPRLSGAMFHCNCENDSFESFANILDKIGETHGRLLEELEWVSLGGGVAFTAPGYPLDAFCEKLTAWSRRYKIQIYLEPGEAAITRSGALVTRVVDIVKNEIDVAIVDAAVETHMLDLLIYGTPAKIDLPANGTHRYMVAGRTCLAGDVFGTYDFPAPLSVGDEVRFADAAGYTMVKKNWFNGVAMPAIAVKRLDGRIEVVRRFGYDDYRAQLS